MAAGAPARLSDFREAEVTWIFASSSTLSSVRSVPSCAQRLKHVMNTRMSPVGGVYIAKTPVRVSSAGLEFFFSYDFRSTRTGQEKCLGADGQLRPIGRNLSGRDYCWMAYWSSPR